MVGPAYKKSDRFTFLKFDYPISTLREGWSHSKIDCTVNNMIDTSDALWVIRINYMVNFMVGPTLISLELGDIPLPWRVAILNFLGF